MLASGSSEMTGWLQVGKSCFSLTRAWGAAGGERLSAVGGATGGKFGRDLTHTHGGPLERKNLNTC